MIIITFYTIYNGNRDFWGKNGCRITKSNESVYVEINRSGLDKKLPFTPFITEQNKKKEYKRV